MSNYTPRPNENWVKDETSIQQKKRALKAKEAFDKRNEGKKIVIKYHPDGLNAKIITYE